MAQPLPLRTVHPEQLTAPGCPVSAQPHAVKRQADHRLLQPVFSQHRPDMREVVLHTDSRHVQGGSELDGKLGAEEIGVQVVCHRSDGRTSQLLVLCQQLLNRRFKRGAGHRIAQIAMYGRPHGLTIHQQAGSIFQPGTESEDRGASGAVHGRSTNQRAVSAFNASRAWASSASSCCTRSRSAAAVAATANSSC